MPDDEVIPFPYDRIQVVPGKTLVEVIQEVKSQPRPELTPEWFGTVEGLRLFGKSCSGCALEFELSGLDDVAYSCKFESLYTKKGDLYHPHCIDTFLMPLF